MDRTSTTTTKRATSTMLLIFVLFAATVARPIDFVSTATTRQTITERI